MSNDLEVRFHQVSATEPAEWRQARGTGVSYPFWDWATIRTMSSTYRGAALVATLHDADRAVGLAVGRLRGLHLRSPAAVVADLDCPPSSATPGLVMAGAVPGTPLTPHDVARYRAGVAALESALRAEFGRRLCGVWHRQVYADLLPAVQTRAAVSYAGKTASVLVNRFGDWETYLAGLRKSRRTDVRRLLRRYDEAADLDVRFDHRPAELEAADVADLGLATARRRHAARWPPVRAMPTPVLAALLRSPSTRTLRYRRPDGTLLGCGLLYEHATTPVIGQWAAIKASTDAGLSGIWFDHMARMVRAALDAGAGAVLGGKGSDRLKEEFGFTSVPQWTVARRLDASAR